ncbi:MAG TPA: hypothetical protein VL027_02070 [Spongiibacteraceae bacterium]|nr:hypothetical protein [Spongiibacteraceae bacterium]
MALGTTRRRGRPATVTRERIAKAAVSVAREGREVSMTNVAAKLKVDVATLYRHLGGQQELARLLAEDAAPTPDMLPDHKNKTVQEWLRELAWFYWDLMRTHSDLVDYTQSAMDPRYELLDHVVGVLVGYGFSPKTASFSYHYLIDVLVGFVFQEIRDKEECALGGGRLVTYQRNLASRPRDALQNVLACELGPEDFRAETAFEMFLTFTVDGICAQLDKQTP